MSFPSFLRSVSLFSFLRSVSLFNHESGSPGTKFDVGLFIAHYYIIFISQKCEPLFGNHVPEVVSGKLFRFPELTFWIRDDDTE